MDLDPYYTPPAMAEAVARAVMNRPAAVCDPSCGDGGLLRAVVHRFPKAKVFGVDRNRDVVRELLRREPSWQVSVGDATDRASLMRTRVARLLGECDLLVMNPPFSMGSAKGVEFEVDGATMRCSRAMQHVTIACDEFAPELAVAVLPESALFSELDEGVRERLFDRYELERIGAYDAFAFSGARARTHLVRLHRRKAVSRRRASPACKAIGARRVELVRGALQLFRARDGLMPFLHTTDLQRFAQRAAPRSLATRKVQEVNGGRVRGHFTLVARVGMMPAAYRPRLLFSRVDVQLSDCLIAVRFASKGDGEMFVAEMDAAWNSVRQLFRGTGAPYITVARLRRWIARRTTFGVANAP